MTAIPEKHTKYNFQSIEIFVSRFSGLNYEELKTKQKV